MTFRKTTLSGCYLIEQRPFVDARGCFIKTFHQELFASQGLYFSLIEQFFSVSHKHVVRGMHFQTPPNDHIKLVTCISGRALDVVLDIRRDSPTYGQYFSVDLFPESGVSLWIPKGLAHGFLSLEDNTCMVYNTTTAHAPESDAGIHWNSFGFSWPVGDFVISDRDSKHPSFQSFISPFYGKASL